LRVPASETLVVNRHAVIRVEREQGAICAVTVRAPVKGEALRVTRIERAAEPHLFGTLLVWSAAGDIGAAGLSSVDRARLEQIGLLVPPARMPTSVFFSCDATNAAPELLPPPTLDTHRDVPEAADLRTSPTLRRFDADGPPPELRGRLSLRNPFDPSRAWLMVDDDPAAAPSMYSYDRNADAPVDRLHAGQPVPDSTPPRLRHALLAAGVIESSDAAARKRDGRREAANNAARTLRRQRFVPLAGLIPPRQVAAARRYYRELIAEGFLPYGDAEWPDRYFATKEPLAYFFHQQLTGAISRIAGEPVKPSFCVFASYRPGAELPPHTDREQCEYSLSILIDQAPEPSATSSWPLYLQPPGAAATPMAAALGDGVLYHGREVTHFRERLATADFCSFWFFFYVPEAFEGSLD
jgi:hypothetical protein